MYGSPNIALKMACKRAFVDAVLRVAGLSGFFTQDLEDPLPPAPVSVQHVRTIRALLRQVGRDEATTCAQLHIDALERLSQQRASKLIDLCWLQRHPPVKQRGDTHDAGRPRPAPRGLVLTHLRPLYSAVALGLLGGDLDVVLPG